MREASARLLRGLAWTALLAGSACALPAARWDVPAGAEDRFAEVRRTCRQLTSPDETRFADCMRRRGFEQESLWQRAWRGLTGA